MLPEIESLLILQNKDQAIRKLQRELTRIPLEEEDARGRLSDDNASVTAIKGKLQQNEIAIKNLQLDIETRRTTITRLKNQQFETKKNEEYRALGNEVVRYEAEVTGLEDKELEFMEIAETLKTQLQTANEKLAVSQASVDEELSLLADRRTNCETQIVDLEAERTVAAGKINDDLLSRYDRTLAAKKDAALVPLQHGTNCGGCHMKVTAATANNTKAEREITACEQCGRILYLDEDS
jgi:predicted  nucleic acid-binding Zn-ribbon protein